MGAGGLHDAWNGITENAEATMIEAFRSIAIRELAFAKAHPEALWREAEVAAT